MTLQGHNLLLYLLFALVFVVQTHKCVLIYTRQKSIRKLRHTLWMLNLEDFKTREELQHSIPAAFAKDLFICGNGFLHTSLSASHVEKKKTSIETHGRCNISNRSLEITCGSLGQVTNVQVVPIPLSTVLLDLQSSLPFWNEFLETQQEEWRQKVSLLSFNLWSGGENGRYRKIICINECRPENYGLQCCAFMYWVDLSLLF